MLGCEEKEVNLDSSTEINGNCQSDPASNYEYSKLNISGKMNHGHLDIRMM